MTRDVAINPLTNQAGCYASQIPGCLSTKIIVPDKLAPFYNAELAQATNELQTVLDGVRLNNTDPNRELSFINTPKGLLLAWVTPLITRQDGDDEFLRALGIQ